MATQSKNGRKRISGYGLGAVDTVLSVDEVARAADELGLTAPKPEALDALVRGDTHVRIDNLVAGYGRMEILHGVSLRVGKGQSLCLIGPNGAGKRSEEGRVGKGGVGRLRSRWAPSHQKKKE